MTIKDLKNNEAVSIINNFNTGIHNSYLKRFKNKNKE